ncbi:MAG: hypothetical protein KF785_04675 [Gemmatimonadales bacterium]|nr:hypothetical protein [Gemmatimonadales bacterium]
MTTIPVRVTVLDTWDEIALNVPADVRVSDVKARALAQAKVRTSPDQYLVKFRGAEVPEGSATMADAGVVPNGALIVLRRHRRPTR